MQLNIKKTLENATIPSVDVTGEYKSINIKCATMGTGVGKDGRIIIEYRSGLSIEIPEGYVGILTPLDNSFVSSLMMPTSITILTSGWNEIIARFKVNTDSIPSVFEQGDEFIKLVLIESSSFTFNEMPSDIPVENNVMSQSEVEEVDIKPINETELVVNE
jgi:hypothetical protein